MSFADLTNDRIVLIKSDGSRHPAKANVDTTKGRIIVLDPQFPVEVGDLIERALPTNRTQMYQVEDPGWIEAPTRDMSHWYMKVSPQGAGSGTRPTVVHNHHYNNSGVVNAMGPDAVASSNTNNVQFTQQTLNLADPRIAAELTELRRALSADDDDDAAIEVGNVAAAQKALKAGDESGLKAALKRFGNKAWGVAEKLALAWMTTEGRHQLGLPPS